MAKKLSGEGRRVLRICAWLTLILALAGCGSVELDDGAQAGGPDNVPVRAQAQEANLVVPTESANQVMAKIAPSATISGALLVSRYAGSTDDAANEGNNASGTQDWPVISGDGNVVVFDSVATNLVDNDSNGKRDIFLRNLSCDTTVRVMGFGGAEPNGDSYKPKVSKDGRYVCFESDATNLVANDTNGTARDIFRYDNVTKEVIIVSVDNAGNQLASGFSTQSSISGDGKRVAFAVFGNLTGAGGGIHVRDLRAEPPQTIRPNLGGGGHGERPVISADGGHVAFWSSNVSLGPDDDTGAKVPDPNAPSEDPDNRRHFDSRIQSYVYHLPGSTTKVGTQVVSYPTGETVRVSINAQGARANDEAAHPSISEDGRYVTFWSEATNLVPEPNPPHRRNIFWHDTVTRTTRCVSLRADRLPAKNGDTEACRISANGQWVAFSSTASDLNGAGPGQQFYLCNLSTSSLTTTLASKIGTLYAGGGLGELSDDGGRISFIAGETLIAGVTGTQVYVRSNPVPRKAVPVAAPPTALVSVNSAGDLANGILSTVNPTGGPNSDSAAVSYDGRYVAFTYSDQLLVPEDLPPHLPTAPPLPTESRQVYLKDRSDGNLTLISPPRDLMDNYASVNMYPAISANGDVIAFASNDRNWNPPLAMPAEFHVVVYNRATSNWEQIDEGGLPSGSSYNPSLSSDGRYVAFESFGQWDTDTDSGESDIFVKDRTTSEIKLISTTGGGPVPRHAHAAKISGDGRYVAFLAHLDNVLSYDTVFVKDRQTGSMQLLGRHPVSLVLPNQPIDSVDISADGRYVVFASRASNLVTAGPGVPADTNNARDIFVADRGTTPITLTRLVNPATKKESNDHSFNPRISDDGRFVVFSSQAHNFVSPDNNGNSDVFAYDLIRGTIQRLSVNSAGVQPYGFSVALNPEVSGDGKFATFVGYDNDFSAYVSAPVYRRLGQLFIKGIAP